MTSYVTTTGRLIKVSEGHLLGRGGEGDVLPIARTPNLVAKILHRPSLERRAKLEAMIANGLPQTNGHSAVAWPTELIFMPGAKPSFAGYLMPKVVGARTVFTFYNPALRLAEFPAFDYRYLVRTARNFASAVALAHRHQCIIGDINESNALVTPEAMVTLIDADSWQIFDASRSITHRCPVGKPEFLPPELQNLNLATIDRGPDQDNFALAVLAFKILTEGGHPCDGVFNGCGDPPPIEARIAAGSFPFRDRTGKWAPKPLAFPFNSLHPLVQQLFIRCFEIGHAHPEFRPDARTWQEVFAQVEHDLHACTDNPQHWHWGVPCPWCARKTLLGGLDPFPARPKATQKRTPHNTTPPTVIESVPTLPAPAPAAPPPPRLWPVVYGVLLLATLGICRSARPQQGVKP